MAEGARGDLGELAPAARCRSLSAASRAASRAASGERVGFRAARGRVVGAWAVASTRGTLWHSGRRALEWMPSAPMSRSHSMREPLLSRPVTLLPGLEYCCFT